LQLAGSIDSRDSLELRRVLGLRGLCDDGTLCPRRTPYAIGDGVITGGMTTAMTKIDPEKRTQVIWNAPGDPWPAIAGWAQRKGFHPRDPQTGNVKMFQKGSGFWTAAMRAQFTYENGQVEMQAWLPISLLARIMALFMLPAEMHIRSGGFRAVLPRKIARDAINELLAEVGAKPIP
jgi:hypothetical protein